MTSLAEVQVSERASASLQPDPIGMGKKGDLSGFERGMVVGARRAGLSISKNC